MHTPDELQNEVQNLSNQNDYKSLTKFLERVINDDLNNLQVNNKANHYLGRIYYYNEQFEKSREYFINALCCDPKDVFSRIYLGLIAEKNNNAHEAIRIYASCLDTNPEIKNLNYKIKELAITISSGNSIVDKILSNAEEKTVHPNTEYPLVSILILCYNKVEYTLKCLDALFANTVYKNYEVIVVDNASVDETPVLLETYGDKIKFVHSKTNLGFVGGNNLAANYAKGEYVVFLNNDTEVKPNWLIYLYKTFMVNPSAGAVGSMLVYEDGTLQEAGGIIFKDATGWNYGKGKSAVSSQFNFTREVDYCSGAALMVRKDLFLLHGKFDERFAPAYFEDTDLCFGIRKLGYKVFYCPFSKVVHHEGITAGTDLSKGFKKFQILNTPKFINKWKHELELQYQGDPNLVYSFSNRSKGKRILIIDDIPPLPDRAAGALRHYHTLKQMLNLGYVVTYVHLSGKNYTDENATNYIKYFKMLGVEFIWFNYESWWSFRETPQVKPVLQDLINSLDIKRRNYDLIYIAFWHIAEYFIDIIRKQTTTTPILIDTMDIHYLREQRQAEMSRDPEQIRKARLNKKKEIEVYSKVDCITTVTEKDRDELKQHLNDKSILILTDVHDAVETTSSFNERKDLLFVGNFNHTPNEDAVLYFCKEIFPLVVKQIPEIKFYIVGNNPSDKINSLASGKIIVTGWVPEIKPYLEKCRVSVVPLRYGAGNKGKVGETLSHGVPMVSTTIGAEGMNIINEVHSFVTDDSRQIAEYIIKLYSDKTLWEKFSASGKALITTQYSSELMSKRLQYIMSFSTRESLNRKLALSFPNPPAVSIILISYNQYDFTKKCLTSILQYSKLSYEIILIDNNSSDSTVKNIKKDFPEVRLIENKENNGFPKAVNQGITSAIGDYVLLLNNDTIVTNGWLEKLFEVAESDKTIGVVGPISNEVSGVQKDKELNYKTIDEMHLYAASVKEKNKNKMLQFPRVAFLCTLIKREVIDKIGGLDERFSPGNFEDDDFCLRAQLAGYKTVIAKDVFIHHYGSKSFKADGEKKYAERLKINHQIFVDKWGADPDEIWLKQKPFNNSRNLFISIDNDEFKKSFERAQNNIKDKEFDLAITELGLAIEKYDTSDKAYSIISKEDLLLLSANVSLIIKDLEKANMFFEEALKLNPSSSEACFGLGQVFYHAEMYEQSKAMFEWAIKNNSKNVNALEALKSVNEILAFPSEHNSLFEVEVETIEAEK